MAMPDGLEPIGLAMIICDGIHVDPGTGKRTLLGLFSAVVTKEVPVTVGHMAVYVAITECRGKLPVMLQIVDVNEERAPVAKIEGEVELHDPLGMVEIDMRMGNVVFPTTGEYRVQFYAEGSPIIERRIVIFSPPKPEASDE